MLDYLNLKKALQNLRDENNTFKVIEVRKKTENISLYYVTPL